MFSFITFEVRLLSKRYVIVILRSGRLGSLTAARIFTSVPMYWTDVVESTYISADVSFSQLISMFHNFFICAFLNTSIICASSCNFFHSVLHLYIKFVIHQYYLYSKYKGDRYQVIAMTWSLVTHDNCIICHESLWASNDMTLHDERKLTM